MQNMKFSDLLILLLLKCRAKFIIACLPEIKRRKFIVILHKEINRLSQEMKIEAMLVERKLLTGVSTFGNHARIDLCMAQIRTYNRYLDLLS